MKRIVAAMALVVGSLLVGGGPVAAQAYGGMEGEEGPRTPPADRGNGGSGNARGDGALARTGTDLLVPLAATGTVVAGVGAVFVVAAQQRRRSMA